jgi:cardiolipin synthase
MAVDVQRAAGEVATGWHRIRRRYKWWQLALFCLGVLASVTVLGALFLPVGQKPPTIYPDSEVPAVASPNFATALSALVGAPVERGGSVDVLNNGDEFLPALLKSLDEATSTIHFSVYIWSSGQMSDQVLRVLERKQQQGVAVRVLLDGLGSIKVSDEEFEPLIAAGGKVAKFRAPRFGKLTRFHRRNHRRAIVIDGAVGYTGGIAVSDVWLGHAQGPDHWRDIMFRVTGPMARSLQTAFVDIWAGASGELLIDPRSYPIAAPAMAPGVERFVHLVNSPVDDEQPMAYFFLVPVLAARSSILMASPYFIPDSHLVEALMEKARAGVDVRLLLPGPHTDNWITRASAQHRYQELLDAGVKIYEYQPTFMHAKYAVFDDRWSVIGSPNLNTRSRRLDEENAFGVYDPAFGERLRDEFFNDLKKATPVDREQWRTRSPLSKAFETISRVLDGQS